MVGEQADYVIDDLADDPNTNWKMRPIKLGPPDHFPCEGKGLSYSAAHCAPPVGYKARGYRCVGCPIVPDRKEGA